MKVMLGIVVTLSIMFALVPASSQSLPCSLGATFTSTLTDGTATFSAATGAGTASVSGTSLIRNVVTCQSLQDFTVEVPITVTSLNSPQFNSFTGIDLFQSPGNEVRFAIGTGTFSPTLQQVALLFFQGGSPTVPLANLFTTQNTPPFSHAFKLIKQGDCYTVFLDGASQGSFTGPSGSYQAGWTAGNGFGGFITATAGAVQIGPAPPGNLCQPTVAATVDIDPDTLNTKSKGQFITAYIELPSGFDVNNIDVSTAKLNGVVPAQASPTAVGDHDNDGVPDLMVKFDRAAVVALVTPPSATLTVTGSLTGGTTFTGSDTIRVINPGK